MGFCVFPGTARAWEKERRPGLGLRPEHGLDDGPFLAATCHLVLIGVGLEVGKNMKWKTPLGLHHWVWKRCIFRCEPVLLLNRQGPLKVCLSSPKSVQFCSDIWCREWFII